MMSGWMLAKVHEDTSGKFLTAASVSKNCSNSIIGVNTGIFVGGAPRDFIYDDNSDLKVGLFHHNAIQYNAIQYNAIQCNALHYNTMQFNIKQFNITQCNAIQCNERR